MSYAEKLRALEKAANIVALKAQIDYNLGQLYKEMEEGKKRAIYVRKQALHKLHADLRELEKDGVGV